MRNNTARALLAEIEAGPMPSVDRVDPAEFIDILREAVSVRNGWKRILQRCAPPLVGIEGAAHPAHETHGRAGPQSWCRVMAYVVA